ncbi:MAG: DUF4388 domain-containing protein [Syntrophaceae bacterium]|nr:DUF4388 domain-containing protein [Syntrophaceae bacterium]
MPETILGELSEAKLFDLIKPFLSDEKTGLLRIKGDEYGEIFLETGVIVHAKTSNSFGEEAFMNIMSWQRGKVTFEPDVPTREKTILIPTETLLLNWWHKKQEWEKIRNLVPSPNAVFRIPLQSNSEEKSIKGDQWNVLALANGTRTVLEIAKTLGWDEFKTSKVIYQLVEAGLLERMEGPKTVKKIVREDFFRVVERELNNIVGPIASILIDNKLSEFGEMKDSFPEERWLSFVEALGEEVPDGVRRKEFIKAVMEIKLGGK